MFLTTSGSRDPETHFPRRPVSYVLSVAARKLGDPIAQFIQMKPDYFCFHCASR